MRRAVGRVRRAVGDLRPPSTTVLRWARLDRRGRLTFGQPATTLDAQPPDRVRIADDVTVGDHVRVLLGPEGRVEIAAGTVVGSHVLLAADTLVRIGPGCRIGDYAVLVDTWTYGRTPPGPVPAPAPDPVIVDAGCRLGMRAVLGPGVRLAAGAVIGTGEVVHATPAGTP